MVAIENKIQRYDVYKDSGVAWLGEIPEHWEALANKFIFNLKKNQVGKNSSEYDLLSLTLRGIVIRNLEDGGKFPAEFDTYQEVKKGDFVFCLFDVEETPRCVGLSDYDGMITGAYTVMEPNEDFDKSFLYYFYLNLDADKRMKPLYTGLRNTISKDNFFAFKTFVPPLQEQTKIAQFLDDKTSKIDAAIGIKEQQIQLLKERKQIFIHKAVTRGLDDSREMKDSGVEWIGEIPEHWEVKRLKYLTKYFKGFAFSSIDFSEKGIPIVKASNIKNQTIENVSSFISLDNQKIRFENFKLYEGDIIISTVGSKPEIKESAVGQLAIINEDFSNSYLNQNTVCIRTASKLINKYFLKSVFISNYMRSNFDNISLWIANQAYIEVKSILEIFIALPSLSEQKEISAYIETASQKIETAIALKQQEIEKLKEYKSSLINSCVTGKVRVC